MQTVDTIIAMMKLHAGVSSAIDLPQGLTWYDLFNLAGQQFVNEHSWSWLEEGEANLEAEADSENLTLPRDFVALISCYARNAAQQVVRIVPRDRMEYYRANENLTGTSGYWYVCFDAGIVQASAAGVPTPIAPIWPTPEARGEPTMRIVYERGWWPVVASEGSTVPKIGSWCTAAFVALCEIVAFEKLHDEASPRRALYYGAPGIPGLLRSAIDKDEERCETVGQVGDRKVMREDDFIINPWTPNP